MTEEETYENELIKEEPININWRTVISIIVIVLALGALYLGHTNDIDEAYQIGYNQANYDMAIKVVGDIQNYGGTVLNIDGQEIVLQYVDVNQIQEE